MQRTLFILCALVPKVFGLRFGEKCDPYPWYSTTWQYDDSCDNIYLYCDGVTSTCEYRGCTNSDYIQNWDASVRALPVRCNSSTYCPDNNSQCLPKVTIGGTCEPQRDDECAGTNSICLNSTCFAKAAPIGGNCVYDSTDYVSYDADGYPVLQTIIRDNCIKGGWCEDTTCVNAKANGSPCQQDRECISETCSNSGVCVNGPDVFYKIPPWLWGVLGMAIVIFALIVLTGLWFLHRYQSKKEHEKAMKFFGDNEEFAKYTMIETDDMLLVRDKVGGRPDSRTSVVYLTTPDYTQSKRMSNLAKLNWPNASLSSTARPSGSGSTTPGSSTPVGRRSQTPEFR